MLKVSLFISLILFVNPFSTLFSSQSTLTYSFSEDEIRDFLPIVTNNETAEKVYARIVSNGEETAYEFMFYWSYQEGYYKMAKHENDWEFVVVYTNSENEITQVSYDSWHYYIGRETTVNAYNDTNVLLYVDPAYHYFKPDVYFRKGNITKQLNQRIYELTNDTILVAQEQVSFDPYLFENPFDWVEPSIFGRYTAFDSWWKAFWVVSDKKLDFIDLSDAENILTRWL